MMLTVQSAQQKKKKKKPRKIKSAFSLNTRDWRTDTGRDGTYRDTGEFKGKRGRWVYNDLSKRS